VNGTGRPRARGGQPRSSIVDVAARAGVSVATVSRALRDMPNVSAATRERVLRAAAELDYSASPLAAGLVTGKVGSVGVISAYAGRWFFAEVLRGIEAELRTRGYDLVLHVLPDSVRREQFFGELPLRRRVDGVIVAALPLRPREVELLHALDLPLACAGMPVEGVHSETIDDIVAARTAAQHLVNLGHRRIAMIGGAEPGEPSGPEPDGVYTVPILRTQGYLDAITGAGLEAPPEWRLDGGFTVRGGQLAMAQLLSQPGGRPTAVLCQSDEMAFGAMSTLRRAGLRCPEDVSVVGFDDHELAEAFELTTVSQPVPELGAAAARWVTEALAADSNRSPAAEDAAEAVDAVARPAAPHPARLVVRGSTGTASTTTP
jgi:LacI family repressor for deo operon, udp, cdd, tsx, nupC, and nupG